MNNVTSTKAYIGAYNLNIETAEGTYTMTLERLESGDWELLSEDFDLCCAGYYKTKKNAINWLTRQFVASELGTREW